MKVSGAELTKCQQHEAKATVDDTNRPHTSTDGDIKEADGGATGPSEKEKTSKASEQLQDLPLPALGAGLQGALSVFQLAKQLSLESDFVLGILMASCDGLEAIRDLKGFNDGHSLVQSCCLCRLLTQP